MDCVLNTNTRQRFVGVLVLMVLASVILIDQIDTGEITPQYSEMELEATDTLPNNDSTDGNDIEVVAARQETRKLEMLNEMLMVPGEDRPLENTDLAAPTAPACLRVLTQNDPVVLRAINSTESAAADAATADAATASTTTAAAAPTTISTITPIENTNNSAAAADAAAATPTAAGAAAMPQTPLPPVPIDNSGNSADSVNTAAASQSTPQPANQVANQPARQSASQTSSRNTSSAQRGRWWVQVASFSKRRNADGYMQKLEDMDLPLRVVTATVQGKTMHRVQVGPLVNKARAVQVTERLRSHSNIDGYVLKQ